MVLKPIRCFVVADGGHARFVYPAADSALHTKMAMDAPHLHDRSSDLGSDRPGRSFESGSITRHAIAPRHDLHAMEKQKFAHAVAQKICAESAANAFDELILVGPPDTLTEIQGHLDTTTSEKIAGTLAKDLTKVPEDALYPHLKEWARPTQRTK